ncbi:MAG: domain containing protein [Rickettsiaceae bacterium]|nr:domain containing protein [Rickettsiaceae bacterium]
MLASVIDTILSSILLAPIFTILSTLFRIESPSDTLTDATIVAKITPGEALIALATTLPSFLLQLLIMAIIVIIFWFYRSATPGKMLLKMKIVDAQTLGTPTKKQLIIRYLGYFISTLPLCFGFIWIYYDKKKQGFHDKIAGTVVIKY